MKIPIILSREPLLVNARVSKLTRVTFARHLPPALLKEPAQFWDEIFIANEAFMLGGITHPRIRRMLAYDAASHQLFLEFIEAATLQDLVQAGVSRHDPARTHRLLQHLAETLADLHAGIFCAGPTVHNDLKSLNVLVPLSAPDETVLIDFSHSYLDGRLPPFITDQKHNPAGTAKYMAPEKWQGDYTQGFKSDVFAFGVMAYYVCTGRHPFEGDAAQIEQEIREAVPPTPIELGVNVPRSTTAIMMSCLEKKPDRRPSMSYVAQSFAEATGLFKS